MFTTRKIFRFVNIDLKMSKVCLKMREGVVIHHPKLILMTIMI